MSISRVIAMVDEGYASLRMEEEKDNREKREERRCGPIFGLTRRVLNLGNPFITPSFTQENPCCAGVGENMATDGFTAVCAGEEGGCTRVGLDLICLFLNGLPRTSLVS